MTRYQMDRVFKFVNFSQETGQNLDFLWASLTLAHC